MSTWGELKIKSYGGALIKNMFCVPACYLFRGSLLLFSPFLFLREKRLNFKSSQKFFLKNVSASRKKTGPLFGPTVKLGLIFLEFFHSTYFYSPKIYSMADEKSPEFSKNLLCDNRVNALRERWWLKCCSPISVLHNWCHFHKAPFSNDVIFIKQGLFTPASLKSKSSPCS